MASKKERSHQKAQQRSREATAARIERARHKAAQRAKRQQKLARRNGEEDRSGQTS